MMNEKWWRLRWQAVRAWLVDYGFSVLVFLAFVAGVAAALGVAVPEDVPGVALKSELLYRCEIGALVFFLAYLAVLIFVLAVNGRGIFHGGGSRGLADEGFGLRRGPWAWWRPLKAWLINYGFAALVFLAFVGGIVASVAVEVPEDLPDLAFGSELLYRLEAGGLAFFIGYLAVLAFVLALNGRGFSHIGPKGFKAEEIVNRTIRTQESNIGALERGVARSAAVANVQNKAIRQLTEKTQGLHEIDEKVLAALRLQSEALRELKERLERLEEKFR